MAHSMPPPGDRVVSREPQPGDMAVATLLGSRWDYDARDRLWGASGAPAATGLCPATVGARRRAGQLVVVPAEVVRVDWRDCGGSHDGMTAGAPWRCLVEPRHHGGGYVCGVCPGPHISRVTETTFHVVAFVGAVMNPLLEAKVWCEEEVRRRVALEVSRVAVDCGPDAPARRAARTPTVVRTRTAAPAPSRSRAQALAGQLSRVPTTRATCA